jgi:hypothetical protein
MLPWARTKVEAEVARKSRAKVRTEDAPKKWRLIPFTIYSHVLPLITLLGEQKVSKACSGPPMHLITLLQWRASRRLAEL